MVICIITWILLTLALSGAFESRAADDPLVCGEKQPCRREGWIDPRKWELWHEQVSNGLLDTAEEVDRFFGDERLDEDNRRTRLRVGLGPRWHRRDGASLITDLKLRLVLPRLKDRFQIVVDDAFEAEEAGESRAFADALKDSEPDTALRYIVKQDEKRRLTLDGGCRFSSPAQAFARVRGRIIAPYPVWELRLSQTVSFFTDDNFIETSEMRWTRTLAENWLFRAVSRLTFEETESGMKPSQSLALFRGISRRRAYQFTVSGVWPEVPHAHETVYAAEFTYRQLLHQWWLFGEVAPGVEFPQEHGYQATPYIGVKLEVVFGNETGNQKKVNP